MLNGIEVWISFLFLVIIIIHNFVKSVFSDIDEGDNRVSQISTCLNGVLICCSFGAFSRHLRSITRPDTSLSNMESDVSESLALAGIGVHINEAGSLRSFCQWGQIIPHPHPDLSRLPPVHSGETPLLMTMVEWGWRREGCFPCLHSDPYLTHLSWLRERWMVEWCDTSRVVFMDGWS